MKAKKDKALFDLNDAERYPGEVFPFTLWPYTSKFKKDKKNVQASSRICIGSSQKVD
jgi:hypothetical protein